MKKIYLIAADNYRDEEKYWINLALEKAKEVFYKIILIF